jgi:hypothetical protein
MRDATHSFVHDLHPTSQAEDHLESDVMVMHIIAHLPASGDPDPARDESASVPVRQEVTVEHAGCAGTAV